MQIRSGFVINPESFWRPTYRISPFRTSDVTPNREIVNFGHTDLSLLNNRFGENHYFTESGKQAINIALQQFDLEKEDEVWILTTSGNFYISSCVTKEIEKYCQWSLERSERTKLIFVNHEFGYCFRELASLQKYGIPIIEDRALSFTSVDADKMTGFTGDFVIYSLPKFFPVSFGGVLQCNRQRELKKTPVINPQLTDAGQRLLSHYLPYVDSISEKRKSNFQYLKVVFSEFGFSPYLEPGLNEVPGVFMFRTEGVDLELYKKFMQANGIESSVFYGTEAFFIPSHHRLNTADMDLFYTLTQYFLKHGAQ